MRDGSLSGKVRTPLRCLSAGYLNLDVVGVVLMEELGKQTEALVFSRWIQSGQRGGGCSGVGAHQSCTPEFPLERTDLIFSS